jgi:hypothetical protein
MDQHWFKSDLFEIEPGEDEEINPRMYGRQLANWLKTRLESLGYEVEPVIAEDWGRCLMVSRDPFMLWVGCGNSPDYATAKEDDPPPATGDVLWTCFAMAEVSFLKRLFTRPDTAPAVAKLNADLAAILSAEPRITLVDAVAMSSN